jgi:hypothetical protein
MDQNNESPLLVVQTGSMQGQRWPIPAEGLTLGRDESCSIPVADRQISRTHLTIRRDGPRTFLLDHDSKNGTWINGNPVKGEVELNDGDVILVAFSLQLLFLESDSTMPLTFEGGMPARGKLRLDPGSHAVFVGGSEVQPPLSVHQYRFLELLFLRAGGIVTRSDIIEHVWPGEDTEGITDQAIDALVRRLRERLKESGPEDEFIMTVRGHGFRLNNPA